MSEPAQFPASWASLEGLPIPLWSRHGAHESSVGPSVDMSHDSHSFAYAYWEPLEFLVQVGWASEWRRIVDTGQDSPDDIREKDWGAPLTSLRYAAQARSVVVLVRPHGAWQSSNDVD